MPNQNTTTSNSPVIIPNAILIFVLIYTVMVLAETIYGAKEESSNFRKWCYYLILFGDLLALLWINAKSAGKGVIQFAKENLEKLYAVFVAKQEKRPEEPDDVKSFVDKFVREDFKNQVNFGGEVRDRFAQPARYVAPIERELIHSKSKIDDRLVSAKLKSPNKIGGFQHGQINQPFTFQDFSERNYPFKYNPQIMNPDNELYAKDYSYRLLKYYQLSQKFKSKLKIVNESDRDKVEADAEDLGVTDAVDSWISNLKMFIINYLIPNLLDNHFENLDHLNKIFENSLGMNIKVVGFMVDDNDQYNFFDEVTRIIRDRGSLGANNQHFGQSSGFNLLPRSNIQLEENRKAQDYQTAFQIFFGDNEKLNFIREKIDEKIRSIQIHKEKLKTGGKEFQDYSQQNLTKTLFSKRYDHISEKKNFASKLPYHPMFSKNKFSSEPETAENLEANLIDNLRRLKDFITYRIHLNELVTHLFLKEHDTKLQQLILEYSLWRIRELETSSLENYKNDSGGDFKNENWFSAFPTDSQLISSLMIKYIEYSRESNISRSFFVNYPFPATSSKNSGSLILYQMNPVDTEPQFQVIYEDNLIHCIDGKENFFYAMTVFLFMVKKKKPTIFKQILIEDLIETVLKY